MVQSIVKEQFDYDELSEAFQESVLKQPNPDTTINSIKQKVQEEYEKALDYIADWLNTDYRNFTDIPPEGLGEVILFDYYGFGQRLDEFAKRLKILQYGGGLIDYYIKQDMIDDREEPAGFPSKEELEKVLYNTDDDFRTIAQSIICG